MTFKDKRMESSYHNHQILDLLLPLPLAAIAVLVQNTHKIVHHSPNMLENLKVYVSEHQTTVMDVMLLYLSTLSSR